MLGKTISKIFNKILASPNQISRAQLGQQAIARKAIQANAPEDFRADFSRIVVVKSVEGAHWLAVAWVPRLERGAAEGVYSNNHRPFPPVREGCGEIANTDGARSSKYRLGSSHRTSSRNSIG